MRLLAFLFIAGAIATGCSPASTGAPAARSGPLKVTATIGMIADVAQVVGGAHVEVIGLMGPGVDPHLYKATQGDIAKLRDADLILYNGLHLEGRMVDVLVQLASSVKTVQVTETIPHDMLREPPEFQGQYDPHVWFDVSMWKYAVERTRDALKEADPANAAEFDANAAAYLAKMDELHTYAKEHIASIPQESRVLVTAHDAFGYFGHAYGIEVLGLQGISTASEYGLQDVDKLVDLIVARKVRAVFVESSISPKSIEALVAGAKSRDHDLKIGGELFSDAMGAPGTPEGTYLGMVRHNVDTIAGALK
jgi:manganese/zinc/iron transport system substrate-binding protein